jgi:hypothetical protein
MSASPRTLKLGQLEELKQKEYKLRVQIDTVVKAMINLFEPLDRDMLYINRIEPKRLKIMVQDIERKSHELTGVLREKDDLQKELGEE